MMMSGFWLLMVPKPAATPERPGCSGRGDAGSGAWGTPARQWRLVLKSERAANRGKDYLIDQLKGERTGFFEKLPAANRTVGQLESKLHHLGEPQL